MENKLEKFIEGYTAINNRSFGVLKSLDDVPEDGTECLEVVKYIFDDTNIELLNSDECPERKKLVMDLTDIFDGVLEDVVEKFEDDGRLVIECALSYAQDKPIIKPLENILKCLVRHGDNFKIKQNTTT